MFLSLETIFDAVTNWGEHHGEYGQEPGWDLVNARIALNIGETWTLGFNAENIFDEDYYVDGSIWTSNAVPGTPAPSFDPVIGTLGQPRAA